MKSSSRNGVRYVFKQFYLLFLVNYRVGYAFVRFYLQFQVQLLCIGNVHKLYTN